MDKSRDAFRTISEVADWLGTPTHVLRFWESRFTQVKPVKRAGGRRYYRPADMLLLGGIKQLLHEDGMTIRGVQKLLREEGVKHVSSLSPAIDDEEALEGFADAADSVEEAPMAVDVPEIEDEPTDNVVSLTPRGAQESDYAGYAAPLVDEDAEVEEPDFGDAAMADEAPAVADMPPDVEADVEADVAPDMETSEDAAEMPEAAAPTVAPQQDDLFAAPDAGAQDDAPAEFAQDEPADTAFPDDPALEDEAPGVAYAPDDAPFETQDLPDDDAFAAAGSPPAPEVRKPDAPVPGDLDDQQAEPAVAGPFPMDHIADDPEDDADLLPGGAFVPPVLNAEVMQRADPDTLASIYRRLLALRSRM